MAAALAAGPPPAGAWTPGDGPRELDPSTLARFVDPLPRLPVAVPGGSRTHDGRPHRAYRLVMRAVSQKAHRDLPPTSWWSFGHRFPGPTIEARRGQPIAVDWVNRLPSKHFLPIDHTLSGAGADQPEVRTVIHLHGGRTPPGSDGFPEAWWTPGRTHTDFYPNEQDATALWYHDHAMGIHRLNVFAGLVGFYIIRDDREGALGLPAGDRELPLIFCDRSFRPDGRLFYPTSGIAGRPWVPEYFGRALLVNGVLFPFVEVEPAQYRFRVLNASNGRFLELALPEHGSVHQIGADQGLLRAPVSVSSVHLAPGERADLIVDFRGAAGRRVVMTNDGVEALQFRVAAGAAPDHARLPSRLRDLPEPDRAGATLSRTLTLGEVDSMTGEPIRMLLNGLRWQAPVTETPALGSTEIWNLVNLTDDAHPVHVHLVRFRILERQPFDVFQYRTARVMRYLGPPEAPAPAEAGWKDTVKAAPGMVTRIVMRFEGYAGRYVWHCHLLEHGDNEMMRPYEVRDGA